MLCLVPLCLNALLAQETLEATNRDSQALSSSHPRTASVSSNDTSSKKPSLNHLAKADPPFDLFYCTLYFSFHSSQFITLLFVY